MSRKREREKRSGRAATARPARTLSPPSAYTPRRFPTTLPSVPYYLRSRPLGLVSTVSPYRTVRAALMRTVRTDTTFRQSTHPKPPRRHSPDVPNRAFARMSSWNTPWPELPVLGHTPFNRAVTCARRAIRREVLFATERTNGSGSKGKPKSKVSCT